MAGVWVWLAAVQLFNADPPSRDFQGMSTKAGAALRRSGVRIRSLGTGHTSLNLVISELSSVRQTLKDSIAAQQRGQGLFVSLSV